MCPGTLFFLRRGAFFQIGGEEAFFRQGVDIPLRDKLRIGVFDCDNADAEVFRKAALRGQFCAGRDLARQNQNENEPKVVSDKPGTSGDYRIIIEGEETDAQTSRSSGTIQFEGGTASGAGLYDGTAKAIVSATPDPGYEINYFYGGPDSEPKKYDNANGGASTFDVSIEGQDHLFHVGFKKKTGSLTINAETGGTVSPNGQVAIQREVPFSIKATPNSGYEFAGWTVNNGSVTIDNANSTSTTATLNSASGTITAQFKQNKVNVYLSVNTRTESNGSGQIDYITYTITSSVQCSLNVSYYFTETTYRDNAQSEKDQWSQTFGSGEIGRAHV